MEIPLGKAVFPGGSFSLPLEGADNCVIMLAWGIHFTANDNGGVIKNRKYYAGSLLEVVHIVDGQIQVFVPEVPETVETPMPDVLPKVQWRMDEDV